MTDIEDRLARVDERLAGQLRRSIEMNARMVTRLQRFSNQVQANGCDSQVVAAALIKISHDEDPI